MMALNFKIIELITEEKRSSVNHLYVNVRKSEGPNVKLTKLKMLTNKKNNNLRNDKTVTFDLATQNNMFLYLEIKRHRVIVSDDLIGKLTLPLEWFPTNHVVREWFPFKQASKKNKSVMILLDIHVDARKVPPFMAPFATLRVLPCWKRPTQTENVDFPVHPPMVYVLSSAEQRTISIQQLREMASTQQTNQSQITISSAQPLPQGYTPVIATQNQLNPNQSNTQQLQRSQTLRQQTSASPQQQQQRPQSQMPTHRQTTNERPPPLPSYPHHSSDDELEKNEEELRRSQNPQNQQNLYPYFSPSGQPYQDAYSPPSAQNDQNSDNNINQYNAPEYQPPQLNTSNNNPTYTPYIY